MPYYHDLHVLFIHIPKTGGTNLETQLKSKNHAESLLTNTAGNDRLPHPFSHVSLQHQYYTTLRRFARPLGIPWDAKLKIMTIVRNPYDRIISALFFWKLIDPSFTAAQVYQVIQNQFLYRTDLDNHNVPQHKFVTNGRGHLFPHIRIFRTELLNAHNELLSDFVGTTINIQQDHHPHPSTHSRPYLSYLNAASISLVNQHYDKDFKLFGYPKIRC